MRTDLSVVPQHGRVRECNARKETHMPLTFDIDRERDLTTMTAQGVLTFEDVKSLFVAYGSAGPTHYELYDFRAITGSEVDAAQVRQLVAIGKGRAHERRPGSKTAALAPDDNEYGLSRMYAMLGELEGLPWEVRVFRRVEEAYEWLGVEG